MSMYENDADLYDVAFSWDITGEVDWLVDRLGSGIKKVLEPACGSGRMLPPFAERGIEVVGIEISPVMIRRAEERMVSLGLSPPRILQGDMADFNLNHTFDGAINPINSFGYLHTRESALAHLRCVARHLKPGRKYLVQMDLFNYEAPIVIGPGENAWEMERGGVKVRADWFGRSFDNQTRLATEVCRFEVLAGPEVGRRVECETALRRWNWADWRALIDESPFTLQACYDGNSENRDPLPLDRSLENRWLIWHELTIP